MKRVLSVWFTVGLLFSGLFMASANLAMANILITPTRVELGDRDRGTRLSVVNTSNKTKTYRIFWREQAQTPDGEYIRLESNQRLKGLKPVSRLMRFSPSQITLAPGERQHIRFAVRRPANLAEGEYRSYLVFEALPDEEKEERQGDRGASFQLKLNLSFSIPVILRQGEPDVAVKFLEAQPVKRLINSEYKYGVDLKMSRKGISSSLGNVKIFWKPDAGGAERQMGILNGLPIYTESPGRNIAIGMPEMTASEDGTLRVIYEGDGVYEGIVFDEHIAKVKASDFIVQE